MLRTSLAALSLLVAVPAIANTSVVGGKGSDVTTPINDTREDILAAAGHAEGVAARAATIIEIDGADRPLLTLPPVSPIASVPVTGAASLIGAPTVFNEEDDSPLPFYLLGLLGLPLLLPGGEGGDFSGPELGGNPPENPDGPIGVPPIEVPVIPEPATWLMLLLGFGATGVAIRHSRNSAVAATRGRRFRDRLSRSSRPRTKTRLRASRSG